MYTVEEIRKHSKIAVFINTQEEYEKLLRLKFNLCSYYGSYYYGVNERMYTSASSKEQKNYYIGYKHIDFSEIDFEEIPKTQSYELY